MVMAAGAGPPVIVREVRTCYDFSFSVRSGCGGDTGLYSLKSLDGVPICFASFFLGFFFSLRCASRLPITFSFTNYIVLPSLKAPESAGREPNHGFCAFMRT